MNKKTLITFGIIIAIAVIAYLLYRVAREEFQNQSSAPYPLPEVEITDTIKPEESQMEETSTTKFNVSPDFKILEPSYSRLPMYEFDSARNFSNEFTNNLPEKLNLDVVSDRQDPVLGRTVIASRGTKNLVIYANKGEIAYTDLAPQSNTPNTKFGLNPEIEPLKAQALEFINSIGLTNQIFQYKNHSYVIANSEHVEIVDQSRGANMIQLIFEAKVEDLPIIDSESTLIPNTITVWMNSKKEIAKLYYQSTGKVGNSFGNYRLLDRDEIRSDLQTTNTKAKLINGSYPIGTPIESINVVQARIAYLSVENYLVPVYILEANVRVAGNRSGTGYLLLEAIKR